MKTPITLKEKQTRLSAIRSNLKRKKYTTEEKIHLLRELALLHDETGKGFIVVGTENYKAVSANIHEAGVRTGERVVTFFV